MKLHQLIIEPDLTVASPKASNCQTPTDTHLLIFQNLASLYVLFIKTREIRNILAILPFRQKLRFFVRVVFKPIIACSWLDYIFSEPLCFLADSRPLYRRLQKPLRPYINGSFTAEERLKSLQEHFDCLKLLFKSNPANFLSITQGGLTVAVFSCKKQIAYELILAQTDHFDREGEFRLTLREAETQKEIGVVAFNLGMMPARRLDIGCIQGHKTGGVEFVREITRDLYGIRPKNLLMFALYDLVEIWNIRFIRAIDNTHRIYAKRRELFSRQNYAQADYELFWKELGGMDLGNGWFKLPDHLKQKQAKEVPSKHRAEHRRKLQLREDIRFQIQNLLSNKGLS